MVHKQGLTEDLYAKFITVFGESLTAQIVMAVSVITHGTV